MYTLVTVEGASFSFLSAATLAYTIGKMFYDLVEDSKEISQILDKISELQIEASEEAQAAAGTKSILRLVYNLEQSFLTIQDVVPQITKMWETERDKIQALIQALEAGASPDDDFDILSIPVANENWQAIGKFAGAIPHLRSLVGKPVILKCENRKELTAKK